MTPSHASRNDALQRAREQLALIINAPENRWHSRAWMKESARNALEALESLTRSEIKDSRYAKFGTLLPLGERPKETDAEILAASSDKHGELAKWLIGYLGPLERDDLAPAAVEYIAIQLGAEKDAAIKRLMDSFNYISREGLKRADEADLKRSAGLSGEIVEEAARDLDNIAAKIMSGRNMAENEARIVTRGARMLERLIRSHALRSEPPTFEQWWDTVNPAVKSCYPLNSEGIAARAYSAGQQSVMPSASGERKP